MIIESTSSRIEILAPAKVNLFLEVLGKRADGFHEIDTVLCPITLFDRIYFERSLGPNIEFELVLPDTSSETADPAWNIPADDSNLVLRALRLVQARLGTSHGGRLRLEKSIPAAAGLGGGSSDAAAAVSAGLIAWGGWNRDVATRVCAELGSDIPFFLGDNQRIGLARATGRGEQCSLLSASPALRFAVTHPPVGCPTSEVYRRFVKLEKVRESVEIIAACEDGQFQKIGAGLFNALQFSAADLTDWIDRQLVLFRSAGFTRCLMSGSGSSCFALLETESTEGRVEGRLAFERLKAMALAAGVNRVYEVTAHYTPSIESQLGS